MLRLVLNCFIAAKSLLRGLPSEVSFLPRNSDGAGSLIQYSFSNMFVSDARAKQPNAKPLDSPLEYELLRLINC